MNTIILNPMPINVQGDMLEQKFRRVGGNSGNLIFYEAVKEEINYSDIINVTATREDVSKDSRIIVPSSNFLCHVDNPIFFERFVKFFDEIDNPITFCGLGAQSTKELNTPKKLVNSLLPIQIEFFKKLSERSVAIGVRGEFTADCLEQMGITNVRIIGCPSFYRYLDGQYPEIKKPTKDYVQVTYTPGTVERSKILKLGLKNKCAWVVQEMGEFPKTITICSRENISPIWLARKVPMLFFDGTKVLNYSKDYSKIFWDVNEWNKFYAENEISFAFGTRFHGNMAALRNGVPALWVTHDSRTKELAEFLKLPNISIKDFSKINSIEEMFDYCDYSNLRSNYKKMCENYISYLDENELNHKYKII